MKQGGRFSPDWLLIVLEWQHIEGEGAQKIVDWLERSDAPGYWQCLGQCGNDDVHGLVFGFSDAAAGMIFMMRWRGK